VNLVDNSNSFVLCIIGDVEVQGHLSAVQHASLTEASAEATFRQGEELDFCDPRDGLGKLRGVGHDLENQRGRRMDCTSDA